MHEERILKNIFPADCFNVSFGEGQAAILLTPFSCSHFVCLVCILIRPSSFEVTVEANQRSYDKV